LLSLSTGEAKFNRPFLLKFAVGHGRYAVSNIWRIWTAKNQPHLFVASQSLSGQLKATVHCPTEQRPTWARYWGFVEQACDPISLEAKRHAGRHKVQWPGAQLGNGFSIEFRIFVRGNLAWKQPELVLDDVSVLPPPSEDECLVVIGILGPKHQAKLDVQINCFRGYGWASGKLCDGRGIWVLSGYTASSAIPYLPDHLRQSGLERFIEQCKEAAPNSLRCHAPSVCQDGSLALFDFPI
jgi:hypothetical protein